MPGRVLLEPGKRIGRFDIQQAIHSTDVSATYKAHDPDYERTVAVKIVYETEKTAIEGHLAAARSASKLDHENIAATHGGGQLQGGVLLVSEYHDGLPLSTRLTRKEAFAWTEVLDIARQIGAAIDYSRTKGAIHQRLHPGNIQVGWDGSIKILDFGSGPASHDAYTGWAYMSPEQVRGEAASSASNVFSLTAMLYQIVIGVAPFSGDTAAAVKAQVLQCQPQNPQLIKANLPESIAAALLRGLSLNPADRYAMGNDLVAELEKHRLWNAAVATPTKPQAPVELNKPLVIGVKPIQPPPAETVSAANSGSFAAASGSYAAMGTGRNPVQTPQAGMRMASQSGSGSLELMSAQETVYGGDVATAPAMPDQHPVTQPDPALDATIKSKSGSNPRLPRQSGALPPLPPAARAELDAAWGKVKSAANSPKRPFERIFMIGGLILLVVLLLAVGVQSYLHHRADSETAANDNSTGSVASTTATPAPVVTDAGSAAVVAEVPMTNEEPANDAHSANSRDSKHKGKTKATAAPVAVAVAATAPGAVMITVQPNDATVFVDGAAFMTGSGIKQLAPGQHTFTFSRSGYSTQAQTVKISSGMQSNLSIRLAAQAAMISLSSSPAGASIYVDGKDTGKLSPAEVTVSEGSHTITLRKYGYLDSINSANARAGQTVAITASLQVTNNDPIKVIGGGFLHIGGGVPSGMVKVKFVSSPKGAQVQINGQILSKGTPVEVALKPGNYQVDWMADGYKTDHRNIAVTDTKNLQFSSELQKF